MEQVFYAIAVLIALFVAVLVLAAVAYAAIVVINEQRWRHIKSDKYEQHNRQDDHQP